MVQEIGKPELTNKELEQVIEQVGRMVAQNMASIRAIAGALQNHAESIENLNSVIEKHQEEIKRLKRKSKRGTDDAGLEESD